MNEHDPLDERLIAALHSDEPVDVSVASAEVVRRGRRRRVQRRAVVAATTVVVVVVLGGAAMVTRSSGRGTIRVEGPSATATSSSPTSTSEVTAVAPAVTSVNPKVTVTPDRGLVDGDSVIVKVTGFGVGAKVWLSECVSAADATDLGCGRQFPLQTLLLTDEHRSGSARFVVHDHAGIKGYDRTDVQPCVSTCVIVATEGIVEGGGGFAYTPIAFDSPPLLVAGPYGFAVPQDWILKPLANYAGPALFASWVNPRASGQVVKYETSGGESGVVYNPDGSVNLTGALAVAGCPLAETRTLSTNSESYTCSNAPPTMETRGVLVVRPAYKGWFKVQVTMPRSFDATISELLSGVR